MIILNIHIIGCTDYEEAFYTVALVAHSWNIIYTAGWMSAAGPYRVLNLRLNPCPGH